MTMRRHKFNAKPCEIGGVRFASRREGRRFLELQLLEKAGIIRDLELQPRFPLTVVREATGEVIDVGRFTGDFRYVDVATGKRIVEDVKSPATAATEAYRLRKRLVEAQHNIQITEVL